jgi:hypothetical protein
MLARMAQPYPSTTPAAPVAKSGGKGIAIGIFLLLFSIVFAIALIVIGAVSIANNVNSAPSLNIPGQGTVSLDAGDYTLYSDALLTPSDVTITGPSGPVSPGTEDSYETFSRDGNSYGAFATITIPSSGSYTFTVKDDALGLNNGRLIIGKGFLGTGGLGLALILLGVFGGIFLFIIGFIVLIVGIVRRGRSNRASAPPPYTGQYPGAPGVPGGPPPVGQPQYGQPTYPQAPVQPAPGGYPQAPGQPAPGGYPQPGAPAPSPYPQAPSPQAPQPPQPGPPPGAPGGPPPPT